MNCVNCNTPLSAGVKFCAQCGAVAPSATGQSSIPAEIAERAADFTGRRWVLNEVLDWIDHGTERFFLITGEPGSGKTALAAWLAGASGVNLADHASLRVMEIWKALHFCVAEDKRGSLNPGRFAQSLAKQLAEQYEGFAYAVLRQNDPTIYISQQAGENRGRMVGAQIQTLIINSNFDDIYNRAVREPLQEIYHPYSTIDRTFILVDALDEAYHFGPVNIVTLLAGSNDLPTGVRFLLTSRRDTDITGKFKSVRRLDLSGSKHERETNEDIGDYIGQRLSELPHHSSKLDLESVKKDLVRRAAGNFLYVRFLLDEVAKGTRTLEELESLPRGLYGLYGSFLDRVVPETSSKNSGLIWREQYQPLLGCLSVALPAAPRANLHRWMGTKDEQINSLLSDVMQITEYDQEYGGAYRLYHRSMAEFLGAPEYGENGGVEVNKYYTPPRDQHDRIIRYYTEHFQKDWHSCDHYGLRQLVNHMQACRDLTETAREKKVQAEVLFDVVLDNDFRRAQRDKLGDTYATLDDLRTALNVALVHDDLVKALACIAAYRSIIRDAYLVQELFEAVTRHDFKRSLQLAAHYSVSSSSKDTWARVLHLYLAWEAATAGDAESAVKAATMAADLPVGQTGPLCDALLAHTARLLFELNPVGPNDSRKWLETISPGHPSADWLLDNYKPAQPLSDVEREQAIQEMREIDKRMSEMAMLMADERNPNQRAQLSNGFFDAESAAYEARNLGEILVRLGAEDGGQRNIERILTPVLDNPYLSYRDLALVSIGAAILSVPNTSFARSQMERILKVTLNSEGVSFTFDLPSMLLAEAESRKLDAFQLADYLKQADECEDLWGTKLRVRSARAAALFQQGDSVAAFDLLDEAAQLTDGFSGCMTVHLLSLLNRWAEFGKGERHGDLLAEARQRAENVGSWEFREQRKKLVKEYELWRTDHLELDTVRGALSKISDPDVRQAYKDFVSARWANEANWEGLKALVPMTLGDGTTLDTTLGRLFSLRIKELSDDELAESIRICAADLTTGRPWQLGSE